MKVLFDAMDKSDADPRTIFVAKGNDGNTPMHLAYKAKPAKCLIEYRYGFDSAATSGVISNWVCPTLFSIRNKKSQMPREWPAQLDSKAFQALLGSIRRLVTDRPYKHEAERRTKRLSALPC